MAGCVTATATDTDGALNAKQHQILEAVVTVVGREGIAGASMRAVAREAGVALGLMNYHFDDKVSLIAAALRHIGAQDLSIVTPADGLNPTDKLRHALRVVASDEYLRPEYLAQRLQLWSLASVNELYAQINHDAQTAYRAGLAKLIADARRDLDPADVRARAADILIIQNGIWLTSILVTDEAAVERSIVRCEAIAFAD